MIGIILLLIFGLVLTILTIEVDKYKSPADIQKELEKEFFK